MAGEAAAIKQCQELPGLKWESPNTYESVIQTHTATRADSKFTALKGECLINAPIDTILAEVHDLTEYTPEMPDKEKDGKVCRYIYFQNDASKVQVDAMVAKKGF